MTIIPSDWVQKKKKKNLDVLATDPVVTEYFDLCNRVPLLSQHS